MKILADMLSSLRGGVVTRINDPILGTFIASWAFCNWSYLALLFWGEGSATTRINVFSQHFHWAVISESWFNTAISFPLLITIFYLFAFPWISLKFISLQKNVNNQLHNNAISVGISEIQSQETLNKAILKANPDRPFLGESLKIDMDQAEQALMKVRAERIEAEDKAKKAKYNAREAEDNAKEAEANRAISESDLKTKKRRAALDLERFNISSAKNKATLSSNRFPSVFQYMSLIEASLKEDDILLSLTAVSRTVSAIFGYQNFELLLNDEKFNNDSLSEVKYLYYENETLSKELGEIVLLEAHENEDLTSESLFEHIGMVFDSLEIKVVGLNELKALSIELYQEESLNLLDNEQVGEVMAMSDTSYDEVYIEGPEDGNFNNGFSIMLTGTAHGNHRKDGDTPGQDMSLKIMVESTVLLGKYALGQFKVKSVSGSLDN